MDMWKTCTYAKNFGCCPENLTEDYYWRNPHAYPDHPPTLLVQPVTDCNADRDAARFYHQTMLHHGGSSALFLLGGSTHEVSPAAFGVVASWIYNLLGSHRVSRATEN